MGNLYKILRSSPSADAEQIKKNYRRLAMRFHPDRDQGNERHKQIFQKISAAYEIIGDVDQRELYDAHGAEYFELDENEFSFPEVQELDIGSKTTKLFFVSARKDEIERDKLDKHLMVLEGWEVKRPLDVLTLKSLLHSVIESEYDESLHVQLETPRIP